MYLFRNKPCRWKVEETLAQEVLRRKEDPTPAEAAQDAMENIITAIEVCMRCFKATPTPNGVGTCSRGMEAKLAFSYTRWCQASPHQLTPIRICSVATCSRPSVGLSSLLNTFRYANPKIWPRFPGKGYYLNIYPFERCKSPFNFDGCNVRAMPLFHHKRNISSRKTW